MDFRCEARRLFYRRANAIRELVSRLVGFRCAAIKIARQYGRAARAVQCKSTPFKVVSEIRGQILLRVALKTIFSF
jgi:hypothetical protein